MTAFVEQNPVAVKVAFEQELRRVSFSGTSFSALQDLIATLFSIDKETIVITYKDDAEDLITMSLDSEVHEAIKLALASENQTLRLFVKGTSTANPADLPETPVHTTANLSSPAITHEEKEATTPGSKKQQWHAIHAAFKQEMHETREALLVAKEAGNSQLVDQYRAKLKEMRERRVAQREQRKSRMEAEHASAPAPTMQAPAQGNCPSPNWQAHAAKHQERKALREAFHAAKQAGNKEAVEELRSKLQALREQCAANQANRGCVIIATPNHVFARVSDANIPNACANRRSACGEERTNAWRAAKQQRQEMWGAFRQEMQGLRTALQDAKARGDLHSVKELRAKAQELRTKHAEKLGPQHGAHFCPAPVPATATPAPAPVPATPAPATAQSLAPVRKGGKHACRANPEKLALWQAFRNERQEILNALLGAKQEGNKQAIQEFKAKLHELRERHMTNLGRRPLATTPAQDATPAAAAHNPAQQDARERKGLWLVFRQQRQDLRAALISAKQSGDANSVKEAKEKLQEFRERVEQAKQERKCAARVHHKIRSDFLASAPITASAPAAPAPAPIAAPVPASIAPVPAPAAPAPAPAAPAPAPAAPAPAPAAPAPVSAPAFAPVRMHWHERRQARRGMPRASPSTVN